MPDAMRFFSTLIFVIGMGLAIGPAAAASGSSNDAPDSTDYAAAREAIKEMRYPEAIGLLKKIVSQSPQSADALNYLAYSYRKLGEFKLALEWYQKALAVNPDHRGANEYLGELYLQMGDLAKAEERLAKLDGLCTFGCEEFDDLKKAIAAYKAKS